MLGLLLKAAPAASVRSSSVRGTGYWAAVLKEWESTSTPSTPPRRLPAGPANGLEIFEAHFAIGLKKECTVRHHPDRPWCGRGDPRNALEQLRDGGSSGAAIIDQGITR